MPKFYEIAAFRQAPHVHLGLSNQMVRRLSYKAQRVLHMVQGWDGSHYSSRVEILTAH